MMAVGECLQEDPYTRMPVGQCLSPILVDHESNSSITKCISFYFTKYRGEGSADKRGIFFLKGHGKGTFLERFLYVPMPEVGD